MAPYTLERYAQDLIRDRLATAERRVLLAQVAHPAPSARSRLATFLRALAARLEPTPEPLLVTTR